MAASSEPTPALVTVQTGAHGAAYGQLTCLCVCGTGQLSWSESHSRLREGAREWPGLAAFHFRELPVIFELFIF